MDANIAYVSRKNKGYDKKVKCCDAKKCSKNGVSLDTLAQLGTNKLHTQNIDDFPTLSASTNLGDIPTLLKRARRKYFGSGLALHLVDASKQNDNSVLQKSYWNTYHCVSKLNVMSDGTLSGHYCKNRWCMVCNSIRTARLINQYQPHIDSWDDKYFVTLTIPNCPATDLKEVLEEMYYTFNKIKERFRKRHQRGQGAKFVGVRKLECTYNAKMDTYHPHFHIVIRGKEIAEGIVKYWLKEYREATYKAQDVQKATSKASKELFKYFTKVITKVDGDSMIYADAMDVIFNAVRGRRTFQPFGFRLSDIEGEDSGKNDKENQPFAVGVREWVQVLADWVDKDTGELLSGYIPGEKMKELVTEKIVVRSGYDGHRGFVNVSRKKGVP